MHVQFVVLSRPHANCRFNLLPEVKYNITIKTSMDTTLKCRGTTPPKTRNDNILYIEKNKLPLTFD